MIRQDLYLFLLYLPQKALPEKNLDAMDFL